MSFKSGFAAVIGKPNAGKSTLINALVGKKVSIVSPKPQTTRNKILGVLNHKDYQVVFCDTPGIHSGANQLDKFMQKSVDSAVKDVDVILLLLDGTKLISEPDIALINKYSASAAPLYVVVTKLDIAAPEKLFAELNKLNDIKGIEEIFCVSAEKGKNLDKLLAAILGKFTDTTRYFDENQHTDKDLKFTVSELVREKLLWKLEKEIPHGAGVSVDVLEEKAKTINVEATIFCEKESHKPIIVGKGGSKIKEVGMASRLAIEKMTGKRVCLTLFVKVVPNWRSKTGTLKDLGYE
ncbi:MAG: GTPase Era [Firmicutes bacterium]|nr:GTPase Era [Bacillota bacterium]